MLCFVVSHRLPYCLRHDFIFQVADGHGPITRPPIIQLRLCYHGLDGLVYGLGVKELILPCLPLCIAAIMLGGILPDGDSEGAPELLSWLPALVTPHLFLSGFLLPLTIAVEVGIRRAQNRYNLTTQPYRFLSTIMVGINSTIWVRLQACATAFVFSRVLTVLFWFSFLAFLLHPAVLCMGGGLLEPLVFVIVMGQDRIGSESREPTLDELAAQA